MENKIGYRPTWAEVNLSCLRHNFAQIQKKLCAGMKIMVTVKADAYGHGLVRVSQELAGCGVDYLGVASIDEAIVLRKSGITTPILVLGMVLVRDVDPLFKYALAQTVCSRELLLALHRTAVKKGATIPIHIKIDTGMGRLGILPDGAVDFVKRAASLKGIKIEGIFTHLACADTDTRFTRAQILAFKRLNLKLKALRIDIPLVHIANSLGVINYSREHSFCTMARPGLIIYGLYPKDNMRFPLRPVLSLKTRIIFVKKVPAGYPVSYGSTYRTRTATNIAVLPIGYGDGYPRNLSNRAEVLVKGKRFKISGRICMDQIMVDVGKLPVRVGDEVVLIGSQGSQRITAEQLAKLSGTIPYEISCGLGSRVPRVYVR